MSVLIKGMEMPQSCWRCPLCLTVDPDTYRCIPTGQDFKSTFDAIDHIVLSCPLVEIPPHGRLVDADELKKKYPCDEDWDYPVNSNSIVNEDIDDDDPWDSFIRLFE